MNVVHFKTRKNATSVDYCEKYSLNAESILRFRLLCTLIADTEFEFQLVLMALMMHMDNLTANNDNFDDLFEFMNCEDSQDSSVASCLSIDLDYGDDHMSINNDGSHSGSSKFSDNEMSYCVSRTSLNYGGSIQFDNSSCIQRGFDFDLGVMDIEGGIMEQLLREDIDLNDVSNGQVRGDDEYGILISIISAILGCSILELDDLCLAIFDLTAVRRHEWDAVKLSTREPKKKRTIQDLGSDCYHYTHFTVRCLSNISHHLAALYVPWD